MPSSLISCGITSDMDYDTLSGTSMAAPNVTGSLALLQQHNFDIHGQYLKAATLKGLVINTADRPTNLPTYQYGWGLLNTKKAAQVISASETDNIKINELILTDGGLYNSPLLHNNGVEPIKLTIVWNDPEGTVPLIATLDPA